MLTAFKTPMGILCHYILSPLLASTIFQHSVCFCPSPSLSQRISHPLLLQLLAASLLIPPSIPAPPFILHFHSSPIPDPSFPYFFFFGSLCAFIFIRVFLVSSCDELPTVSLSCHLPPSCLFPPTTSSLHPTLLLLIGREGGG